MAKAPMHEDTSTGAAAPEQQAPQSNELAVTLAAIERENISLADDNERLITLVATLEAENASLKEERAQQHNIVMDLHAQLRAMRAPSPAEKVITARNVRNYGE